MVIKSTHSRPIPHTHIASFVFGSANPLPNVPLLISADDPGLSLSLRDYMTLSKRFAHGLRSKGFQDGERVLLASANSVYGAVVFMGNFMAGGIFVGVQHSYDSDDVARQLLQTRPRVVLLTEAFEKRVAPSIQLMKGPEPSLFTVDEDLEGSNQCPSYPHWTQILSPEEASASFEWAQLDSSRASDSTASLIYSSYTSGNPKGVELSHHQIVAAAVHAQQLGQSTAEPDD